MGVVAKVRPCLVQNVPPGPQDRVLATVVGHTASARGSRFVVVVSARFLEVGAFDAQSLVTVPHAKLIRKLGELSTDQVATVEEAIRRWLGL